MLLKSTYCLFSILFMLTVGAHAQSSENSVIYDGKGVDSLKMGTLTSLDVKQMLGNDFIATNHSDYSIELFYPKLGMAFYRKYGPDTGKIFCMSFRKDYLGKTSRGFKMSSMTVQDILRLYGKANWTYLERDSAVYASYEEAGIYFAIKPRGIPPAKFNAEKPDAALVKARNDYFMNLYYNDQVEEITIGVPGTDF
ncbi:hypothetical protein C8P68_101532 [Mucilaginibacter yixingensis]|uniref:GLPGLI family protein n=1 Tax=Mucilaginibacter yixingensis TaxID=1295612 RepID=A0A2T5JFU4_9SPHI|nr:hypothetical protein [Mucilaginibacter yixingensis]PTR01298.1 hypothetical protein C8P68_101532 [Mucilaginibacter yixingensis]